MIFLYVALLFWVLTFFAGAKSLRNPPVSPAYTGSWIRKSEESTETI